jgi:hypothetical protein
LTHLALFRKTGRATQVDICEQQAEPLVVY